MWAFISPSSQAFSRIACGQVPSLSYSQATGRISFSAKSCAISRRAICSSVSVKSTISELLASSRLTGQSTRPMVPALDANGTMDVRAGCAADRDRRRGGPSPGWSRSRWRSSRGAYDHIGRGDLTFDREAPRARPIRSATRRSPAARGHATPAGSPAAGAARRRPSSSPRPDDGWRRDPGLRGGPQRAPVARGQPPLDVEAEVERRLSEPGRVASRPCLPCAASTSTSSSPVRAPTSTRRPRSSSWSTTPPTSTSS